MAGFEPASEGFNLQTSTSLVYSLVSLYSCEETSTPYRYPLGSENPLFNRSWRSIKHRFLWDAVSMSRKQGALEGGLSGEPVALSCGVKPLLAVLHSQCDWHLSSALVLRARRLSACSLWYSTSVETIHPQRIHIIA